MLTLQFNMAEKLSFAIDDRISGLFSFTVAGLVLLATFAELKIVKYEHNRRDRPACNVPVCSMIWIRESGLSYGWYAGQVRGF